jgi:hypothetical protein
MDDEDNGAVAAFGRQVIETGRDYTIDNWFATFDGRMRFPGAQEIEAEFRNLPLEAQEFVRQLVVQVTDEAVSNTLWSIERLPWVSVLATDELTGEVTDIGDASDGLTAALEGDDGWRARFARHR